MQPSASLIGFLKSGKQPASEREKSALLDESRAFLASVAEESRSAEANAKPAPPKPAPAPAKATPAPARHTATGNVMRRQAFDNLSHEHRNKFIAAKGKLID